MASEDTILLYGANMLFYSRTKNFPKRTNNVQNKLREETNFVRRDEIDHLVFALRSIWCV